MFGPPVSSEERREQRNNCYYRPQNVDNTDADIVDIIGYDEDSTKKIEKIYNRICECADIKETNPQSIYVSVIYNVIFFPDENLESKIEENSDKQKKKEKANEEEEKANKKEVEKVDEKKEKKKEKRPAILPIPVFTIRLNSKAKFYIGRAANDIGYGKYIKTQYENTYETQYIDTNARVYNTWTSYVTTNLLPECTMVLPKDGVYKPDPNYPIAEDYSTVWIEIMDSPACTTAAKVKRRLDYASTAAGIAGLGLGVASLFTPAAPFVVSSKVYVS